jgi:hypothetical protein
MPNHWYGILWLGDITRENNDTSRRGKAFGQKSLQQPKISRPNASPNHYQNVSPIQSNGDDDTPCKGEAFGPKLLEQPKISWPNASPNHYPHMLPNQSKGTKPDSIAAIVQNFKSVSTRHINKIFVRKFSLVDRKRPSHSIFTPSHGIVLGAAPVKPTP